MDHLEPYRQMARSIRFVPPLPQSLPQRLQQPVGLQATPVLSSWANRSPEFTNPPTPPVDPSQHVAELVLSAVSQPTVLPPVYAVPDNIGDQISRLSPDPAVAINSWLAAQRQTLPGTVSVERPEDSPAIEWASQDGQSQALPQTTANAPALTEASSQQALELAVEIATQAIEANATAKPANWAASAPTDGSGSEDDASRIDRPAAFPTDSLLSVEPDDGVAHWLGNPDYLTAEALVTEKSPAPAIACPQCGSDELRKNGRRSGKQKYVCKDCGRQFMQAEAAPAIDALPADCQPAAPLSQPAARKQAVSKKSPKGFGASTKSGKAKSS